MSAPPKEESAELRAQRDRLLEKFTIMQADLGGAFYEMAIRDHVRMDVLTRKAAELQRVDAELLALERELELQRSDAAGLCPSCNAALHAVARAQVEHRLPPRVGELYHRFSTCEVCGRVFWEGAHWQRMRVLVELPNGCDRQQVPTT